MSDKEAQSIREVALAIIFGVVGAWMLAAVAILIVAIVKVVG